MFIARSKCRHLYLISWNSIQLRKSHVYSDADLRKASEILIKHRGRDLIQKLNESDIRWSPVLVEQVLKIVWNDGTRALDFFNWLGKQKSYRHSQESYNYMIDILGRMRNYSQLWHLVANMRRDGYTVMPKTFAIIMERYVAAGKDEKATRVFTSMQEYGCFPDLASFNSFLDILCKARKVKRAERLFRILKRRFPPDCITYNTLANGWCLVKNMPMAERILKEMINKGLEPTSVTYNTLLHGFFRTCQVKKSWEFFKEIKRRGFCPNVVTYSTIIYGLGMAGKTKKARKVFNEMVKNGCTPNVATYNALIQVLCRKENVNEAFRVFDEMLSKGYVPNLTTYNILVRGLCHAKEMDRALDFVGQMEKNGCCPDVRTFNIIISYFCDAGEIEKACNVMKDMGHGPALPNLDTYNILLSALCATGKSQYLVEAGRFLKEMIERGYYPRRLVYHRVIDGLFLAGHQDFAREILRTHSQSGCLPREFRM